MRVLLLGILTPGTGNCTTLTRIESELRAAGLDPLLQDCQELMTDDALQDLIRKQHIEAIIGLHALHAGRFLRHSTVPYALIFGGTDVHEYAKIPSDLKIMTEAITNATTLVCFDTDSRERVLGIWPQVQEKCECIPQAVHMFALPKWSLRDALDLPDGAVMCVLPTGLRVEKNPSYLIDMFEAWHQEDPRIFQVVIGPDRNKHYAEDFRERLKTLHGTKYLAAIPQAKLQAAFTEALAVLNTSESEMMPSSLLEAMAVGVPVVARDIPGNRSIVREGETGLVFGSPAECRTKLQKLLDQPELALQLRTQAKAMIERDHSVAQEQVSYETLVRSLLQA